MTGIYPTFLTDLNTVFVELFFEDLVSKIANESRSNETFFSCFTMQNSSLMMVRLLAHIGICFKKIVEISVINT